MNHDAQSHPSATSSALGFILPLGSIAAVTLGAVIAVTGGGPSSRVAWMLTGIGVLLAVGYLVLTAVRFRSRSGARTAISALVGTLLLIGSSVAALMQIGLAALALAFAPDLATVLQNQATQTVLPASVFNSSEPESGILPDAEWTNPSGSSVVINLKWVREKDGVVVTASPAGQVPEKQDGTPRKQLFFGVDALGFPLDWLSTEGKQPFLDIFADWFVMLDELVAASAGPVISAARADGDRLPANESGQKILDDAKKRFTFEYKQGGSEGKSVPVTFDITGYSYDRLSDDRFKVEYAWSCDFVGGSTGSGNASVAPVTGRFTVEYASSGYIVMMRRGGSVQDPFSELLKAYEERSDAQTATGGDTKGSQASTGS